MRRCPQRLSCSRRVGASGCDCLEERRRRRGADHSASRVAGARSRVSPHAPRVILAFSPSCSRIRNHVGRCCRLRCSFLRVKTPSSPATRRCVPRLSCGRRAWGRLVVAGGGGLRRWYERESRMVRRGQLSPTSAVASFPVPAMRRCDQRLPCGRHHGVVVGHRRGGRGVE